MNNFTYYTPTKVVFGKNSINELRSLLIENNVKSILLHYGKSSIYKLGILDIVYQTLNELNIKYLELGGVVPNPRLSLVYEGINICKENKIDFILAIGGGSVIDSAKAIGYGVYNNFDVWKLYNKEEKALGSLPIGVILTIAASGSEMSDSSVITKEEGLIKRGYNSNYCRPKFAIMDPTYTLTLPKYQTMAGCADILMHTMERYFTSGGNMEITDSLAEGLMKTVIKHTLILLDDPNNYDSRAEIMWAGSLSHNGLTGCGNDGGDFATHRLEHELSGLYDVTHGAGLCALWPSFARYVYKDCVDRFKKFSINVMDVDDVGSDDIIVNKGIKRMEEFYLKIGMPITLSMLGVSPSEEELRLLARKCSVATGGHVGSAKVLYEEDMYNIFKMAL